MRRVFKIIPVILVIITFGVGTLLTALFRPSPARQRSEPYLQPRDQIMNLKSSALSDQKSIPSKYTCDGKDISPPLEISEVPAETQSLVLIVDDPDAPAGDWVHWTVWNIASHTTEIAEDTVPKGAVEGMTDFGEPGYGGPCPPSGEHRYFFKLYALDTNLDLDPSAKKADIEQAIKGHILAQAQLVGLYERE